MGEKKIPAKRTEGENQGSDKRITPEHWSSLLSAANQGNYLFPQAFVGQAIVIGRKMVAISEKENIPLSLFFAKENNPPTPLIDTLKGGGKINAHKHYGFTTTPNSETPHLTIWNQEKVVARDLIYDVASLVQRIKTGEELRRREEVAAFPALLSDPLVGIVLQQAEESLHSEPVTLLSTEYKKVIIDFIQKYDPTKLQSPPKDYLKDYLALKDTLLGKLRTATDLIKDDLETSITKMYPTHTGLRTAIDPLFKNIYVAAIDPLKQFRQQHS